MRIGKVVGRLCLNDAYDTLVGGRFLIIEVQDRQRSPCRAFCGDTSSAAC